METEQQLLELEMKKLEEHFYKLKAYIEENNLTFCVMPYEDRYALTMSIIGVKYGCFLLKLDLVEDGDNKDG